MTATASLACGVGDAVDRDPERAPRLLAEMVQARSVNPWFGAGDADSREARVQRLLRPRLEALGGSIDEWEPDAGLLARHRGKPGFHEGRDFAGRPNLVGRLAGTGGGRSLLLLGHADTVSIDGGWSLDPFAGARNGGAVIGRGAVDMKGGMAAALSALEMLAELGVGLCGDVLYASVVDEEAGGMGTLAFVDRGHRADGAIIPEPTALSVAPICRGVLWCKVTIPGRAGHIEIPQPAWEHGGAVDAIGLGRDLLAHIDELNRRWATEPRKCHPLLPEPCQAIISVIRAGSVPSSWAADCELSFDIQYLPDERDENGLGTAVRAEFEASVQEWAGRHGWLASAPPEFTWMVDADCAEISAEHPLVSQVAGASEGAGIQPRVMGIPFHTDMGILVNAGIPTVNFGPGDPALAHQPDEALSEVELNDAVKAIALATAGWCGVGGM